MNKTEYYPEIKLQKKYKWARIFTQQSFSFWFQWMGINFLRLLSIGNIIITVIALLSNILYFANYDIVENFQLLINFILWITIQVISILANQKIADRWLRPSVMVSSDILRPFTDESLVLYNDGISYTTDIVDLFLPYSRVKRIEFDEKTSSVKVIGSVKGVYLATYKGEKESYARNIRDENSWRITIPPYYEEYAEIVSEICQKTSIRISRKESNLNRIIDWADIFY